MIDDSGIRHFGRGWRFFEDEPFQGPVVQQQQTERQRHEHRFCHQADNEDQQCQQVPGRFGAFGVTGVGEHCQQPEKGAEHVLALGDPGDGLDVQGVQGEEGGDKCARPAALSHSLEENEQQNGVRNVPEDVDQMVGA